MVRRQTWVLLVVFVVLLGVVFYLQKNPQAIKSADITPSPTAQLSLLPGLKEQDINFVELKDSRGNTVQISKGSDGKWVLMPENKPVDTGKAGELTAQIVDTHILSTLPADFALGASGLNKPTQVITVGSIQGKKMAIKIGSATPTGSGYYVQVDNGTPTVIDSAVVDTLTQQMSLAHLAPTPTLAATVEATTTQAPAGVATPTP